MESCLLIRHLWQLYFCKDYFITSAFTCITTEVSFLSVLQVGSYIFKYRFVHGITKCNKYLTISNFYMYPKDNRYGLLTSYTSSFCFCFHLFSSFSLVTKVYSLFKKLDYLIFIFKKWSLDLCLHKPVGILEGRSVSLFILSILEFLVFPYLSRSCLYF